MTKEKKPNFTNSQKQAATEKIVQAIVIDINHRSGFGGAFRLIDSMEKTKMIDYWQHLISACLDDLQ